MSQSLPLHIAFNAENKKKLKNKKPVQPVQQGQKNQYCSSSDLFLTGKKEKTQLFQLSSGNSHLQAGICGGETALQPEFKQLLFRVNASHHFASPVSAIKRSPLGTQNKTYKIQPFKDNLGRADVCCTCLTVTIKMTDKCCNTEIAFYSQK